MRTLLEFCATAAIALHCTPVLGSAEGGVPSTLTEVTISTNLPINQAGYEFKMKLNEKGRLMSLVSTYKDKTLQVAQENYPTLNEVDLRQAYVVAPYDNSWGPQESVILVVPFEQEHRKDPENKDKSDTVRVSNVIRLLFNKGELLRWEMAVSLGAESGAWALTYQDKGEAVVDNGKETELNNPYWTHTPVNYSTPWTKEP